MLAFHVQDSCLFKIGSCHTVEFPSFEVPSECFSFSLNFRTVEIDRVGLDSYSRFVKLSGGGNECCRSILALFSATLVFSGFKLGERRYAGG